MWNTENLYAIMNFEEKNFNDEESVAEDYRPTPPPSCVCRLPYLYLYCFQAIINQVMLCGAICRPSIKGHRTAATENVIWGTNLSRSTICWSKSRLGIFLVPVSYTRTTHWDPCHQVHWGHGNHVETEGKKLPETIRSNTKCVHAVDQMTRNYATKVSSR